MAGMTLSAKLDRTDGSTPWGFRMQGGKDFGTPLAIQRVTPGSLAAKCGLQVGDVILKIGGIPADSLRHKEAQGRIVQSGNSIELTLQRGSGSNRPATAPAPAPASYGSQQPTYGYGSPNSSFSPGSQQNYNSAPQPFSPGGSTVPVAVNKQYNTPMNMYSVDNVMESLASQTSNMNMGGGVQRDPGENGSPASSGSDSLHGPQHENSTNSDISQKPTSVSPSNGSTKTYTYNKSLYSPSPRGFVPSTGPSNFVPKKFSEDKTHFTPIKTENQSTFTPTTTFDKSPETYQQLTPPLPQSEPPPQSQPPLPQSEPPAVTVTSPTSPPISPEDTGFKVPKHLENSPTYKLLHGIAANEQKRRASQPVISSSVKAPPSQKSHHEAEDEGRSKGTNPRMQSRTFKLLQNMIETGEDIPSFTKAKANSGVSGVAGSRRMSAPAVSATQKSSPSPSKPYVKAIVNNQYNTPAGLYSSENAQSTFADQSKVILSTMSEQGEEQENSSPSQSMHVTSKAFDPQKADTMPAYVPPAANATGNDMSSKSPGQDGVKIYTPSETYKLVHESDHKENGASPQTHKPIQTKTFQKLEQSLMGHQPSGPPPGRAPPPGTWQPKIPTGPRKMRLGKVGDAKSMSGGGGGRIPICSSCGIAIRGPFVLALEKSWCPDHFLCSNPQCRCPLINCGFVEEEGQIFCEKDYAQYFAPKCGKCGQSIVGEQFIQIARKDCVNAMKDTFHPHCFLCSHCRQPIGTGSFHMEDGQVYCEKDWQSLYQTKCYGCQFPIEPGDRWVEALNENWHSECFNCSTCQVNLEGQGFFAKEGKPYCKKHAATKRF